MSHLERSKRIDAEFYQKQHLHIAKILSNRPHESIEKTSIVADGNHFAISESFQESGIPYYRGQDCVGNFFIEYSQPVYIDNDAFNLSYMVRSHLKKGDVLLSIVGSIGELSLVSCSEPATCSCKLAILRPKHISAEYLASYLKSKFGQNQFKRFTRGAVQMGLLLEDMDQLFVIRLSDLLEKQVSHVVNEARRILNLADTTQTSAEQILLSALNLTDWQPPEPLTYSSQSSLAFAAGRLDAEYYQPKYDDLFRLLKQNSLYWRQVKDICVFNSRGKQPDYYAEGELPVINSRHILEYSLDYDNFERTYSEKWTTLPDARVLQNDILTYTTGANVGRTSPYLETSQALASNHVNILRLQEENPIYVAAVMNSTIGRMQTKRLITGSAQAELYPTDIDQFIIPFIDQSAQQEIINSVLTAHAARKTAKALLEAAKRAVEIAIEDSETAAITWLQEETSRLGVTL